MTAWPRGVRFRPIERWPGELRKGRKASPFRANWSSTLSQFDQELRQLKAKNVVIQVAMSEQDIRLDGLPRADRRPSHPGVIVSMDTPYGPLSYPCDSYWDWTDNLRAIVLALTALRAVDRYGVTKHGEQYTGWRQLGAGPVGNPRDAAVFIGGVLSLEPDFVIKHWPDRGQGFYRAAAMKVHPDVCGSEGDFRRLQAAKRVLDGAQ